MSSLDWILLVLVASAWIAAVRWLYKNRKNGGCAGCGGNCSTCMQQKNIKK